MQESSVCSPTRSTLSLIDPENWQMSENARSLGRPTAAFTVVDRLAVLCRFKNQSHRRNGQAGKSKCEVNSSQTLDA